MINKIFKKLRYLYYLRSFRSFKKKGKNLIFSKGGTFIRPNEISFGNNIFISRNFHISARNLSFGNDIMIGPNLVIECDNHVMNVIGKKMYELRDIREGDFVTIENDIWMGANVTVLSNIIIPEGVIIGAGSIVNKNMPPYTICVGVPCKPIKPRFNVEDLKKHLDMVSSDYNYEDIIKKWQLFKLI